MIRYAVMTQYCNVTARCKHCPWSCRHNYVCAVSHPTARTVAASSLRQRGLIGYELWLNLHGHFLVYYSAGMLIECDISTQTAVSTITCSQPWSQMGPKALMQEELCVSFVRWGCSRIRLFYVNYGPFAPKTILSRERKFQVWNFCSLELSFPPMNTARSKNSNKMCRPTCSELLLSCHRKISKKCMNHIISSCGTIYHH